MKLMNYELPLGISVTQHPAEMIDEFVENGFEYFKLMPESRACSICKGIGEETGKNPVRIADMEIGKNAPPIHPYCRCAVAEVE